MAIGNVQVSKVEDAAVVYPESKVSTAVAPGIKEVSKEKIVKIDVDFPEDKFIHLRYDGPSVGEYWDLMGPKGKLVRSISDLFEATIEILGVFFRRFYYFLTHSGWDWMNNKRLIAEMNLDLDQVKTKKEVAILYKVLSDLMHNRGEEQNPEAISLEKAIYAKYAIAVDGKTILSNQSKTSNNNIEKQPSTSHSKLPDVVSAAQGAHKHQASTNPSLNQPTAGKAEDSQAGKAIAQDNLEQSSRKKRKADKTESSGEKETVASSKKEPQNIKKDLAVTDETGPVSPQTMQNKEQSKPVEAQEVINRAANGLDLWAVESIEDVSRKESEDSPSSIKELRERLELLSSQEESDSVSARTWVENFLFAEDAVTGKVTDIMCEHFNSHLQQQHVDGKVPAQWNTLFENALNGPSEVIFSSLKENVAAYQADHTVDTLETINDLFNILFNFHHKYAELLQKERVPLSQIAQLNLESLKTWETNVLRQLNDIFIEDAALEGELERTSSIYATLINNMCDGESSDSIKQTAHQALLSGRYKEEPVEGLSPSKQFVIEDSKTIQNLEKCSIYLYKHLLINQGLLDETDAYEHKQMQAESSNKKEPSNMEVDYII